MSLENVVEDIRKEARDRAEEIEADAEDQAQELISEAEAEAEEIIAQREEEIERQIDQERERRISSANLEAKQEILQARREVLSEVRATAEDELASKEAVRTTTRAPPSQDKRSTFDEERRAELTATLLEDALAEFEGQAEVYCRPEDTEMVRDILESYEDVTLAGKTDCLGGVVVESPGSRVRVRNTFDSILEEVWSDRVREINDRLFEVPETDQ